MYPRAFKYWNRIIDFGNDKLTDSVIGVLSDDTIGHCGQYVSKGALNIFYSRSAQALQLNKWQHVAFTFSSLSQKANIYVDGNLTKSAIVLGLPNNLVRTSNFIGKSNNGDPNVDAIYDEIKIFSIALSQSQIQAEMTNEYFLSSLITTTTSTTSK